MAIPRNEQETTLVWDRGTETWSFYSSDPVHIRKWGDLVEVESRETEDGKDVSIAGALHNVNVMVSKKVKRVLTEEQREEARIRMKELHRKKAENKHA